MSRTVTPWAAKRLANDVALAVASFSSRAARWRRPVMAATSAATSGTSPMWLTASDTPMSAGSVSRVTAIRLRAILSASARLRAWVLATRLADQGVKGKVVLLPTTEQAVTAHAMMLDAIGASAITHYAQPGLDAEVANAGRRLIGNNGGWGWTPLDKQGDVALLDAVTLAHWAAKVSKRRPGQRQKITY